MGNIHIYIYEYTCLYRSCRLVMHVMERRSELMSVMSMLSLGFHALMTANNELADRRLPRDSFVLSLSFYIILSPLSPKIGH